MRRDVLRYRGDTVADTLVPGPIVPDRGPAPTITPMPKLMRVPGVRWIGGRMFVSGECPAGRVVWFPVSRIRWVEPGRTGHAGVGGTTVSTDDGPYRYSGPIDDVMAVLAGPQAANPAT